MLTPDDNDRPGVCTNFSHANGVEYSTKKTKQKNQCASLLGHKPKYSLLLLDHQHIEGFHTKKNKR